MQHTTLASAALLLSVLMGPLPAAGQLPGAGPEILGTADTHLALARGFSAVGLNPAGLGMPDNPAFSLAILPMRGNETLDPITLGTLADVQGELVPTLVKEQWLQDIIDSGGERGGALVEATLLSFNAGWMGVQLSTVGSATTSLNADAAELLLFGNAGRTGEPGDFDLSGSQLDGFAVTTLGVSAGIPLTGFFGRDPEVSLAMGVTLKYSVGNAFALGVDSGTLVESNPVRVEVSFPVVHSDMDDGPVGMGNGVGMDVGAAWSRGRWKAAAVARNVFNTFQWDVESMVYRAGTALYDGDQDSSDFDERPVGEAPQSLRDQVEDLRFRPELAAGAAWEAHPAVTVTGEVGTRLGDGLVTGPKRRVGVGVEMRPTSWLPLWGGVSAITDGYRLGGGLGVHMGPVRLAGAASYQNGDAGEGMHAAFSLSFGSR